MPNRNWTPEPWDVLFCLDEKMQSDTIWKHVLSSDDFDRARACVNACAGMDNPEAEINRLRRVAEAADTLAMICGRTGDHNTDFEEIAAAYRRSTGKLAPGKDAPMDDPFCKGSFDHYREWVTQKMRDACNVIRESETEGSDHET